MRVKPVTLQLDVGERVLQGVAHPGLGGEVDHPVVGAGGEGGGDRFGGGDVAAVEAPVGAGLGGDAVERGQPGFLERRVVIVVDHVEAGDRVAAAHQRRRDVEADEAGAAGDEDPHAAAFPFPIPAPRPMA